MLYVWIAMFALSAILPTVGVARILVAAYADKRTPEQMREQSESDAVPLDDWVDHFIGSNRKSERREAWINITLIGLGVSLGAAASIWSLV